jgi:ABC-type nitrate/sulfonate/bicarbonate transport system permease component
MNLDGGHQPLLLRATGIWSKVLVVIMLVLFRVTINTEAGLRTTSERLVEMVKSFCVSIWNCSWLRAGTGAASDP